MNKRILIINGPNLNLLGTRETNVYGSRTWDDFFAFLCKTFSSQVTFDHFQSNGEGEIIDRIQKILEEKDLIGLIINPGAYSHYSLAIADALTTIKIPIVEVHISNIMARESSRRICVTAAASNAMVCGLGLNGYVAAARALLEMQ